MSQEEGRRSARDIAAEQRRAERSLGPFYVRHRVLLLSLLGVLVLGSYLHPLLEHYRAIVLEMRGDEVFVQLDDGRFVLLDRAGELGDVLQKRRGHFSPEVVPATERDAALLATYARFRERYNGTIVEVAEPQKDAAAARIVVRIDETTRELEVFDESFKYARPGDRVIKRGGSWEPSLVPSAAP